MEAARVAALRGHQVTLWEKASRLGGQLVQAAIPPYKDRVGRLTEYLETQLKKLNVKIELHKEATAAMVEEFALMVTNYGLRSRGESEPSREYMLG